MSPKHRRKLRDKNFRRRKTMRDVEENGNTRKVPRFTVNLSNMTFRTKRAMTHDGR